MVCLQETKLGDHLFNPGFNYKFYPSPPPISDRAKGGTAILVSESLQHNIISLNTGLQAVAVQILFNRFITVCSLYLPPDCNFNLQDLQALIDELPAMLFWVKDSWKMTKENRHSVSGASKIGESTQETTRDLPRKID